MSNVNSKLVTEEDLNEKAFEVHSFEGVVDRSFWLLYDIAFNLPIILQTAEVVDLVRPLQELKENLRIMKVHVQTLESHIKNLDAHNIDRSQRLTSLLTPLTPHTSDAQLFTPLFFNFLSTISTITPQHT